MLDLWIDADNLLELSDVRLASDGSLTDSLDVSAQLRDEDLASIGSPVTLEAVDGSEGTYQGNLPGTSVELGAIYFVDITLTGEAEGFRRVKCRGVYQQED